MTAEERRLREHRSGSKLVVGWPWLWVDIENVGLARSCGVEGSYGLIDIENVGFTGSCGVEGDDRG